VTVRDVGQLVAVAAATAAAFLFLAARFLPAALLLGRATFRLHAELLLGNDGRRRRGAALHFEAFRRLFLHVAFELANDFAVGTEESEGDFGAGFLIAKKEVDDQVKAQVLFASLE
jgi:hypothetical protein